MTWWEWLAVAIWGPTTFVGVVMIVSLPASALWRRLHAGTGAPAEPVWISEPVRVTEPIRLTEPARAFGEQVA